jgi:hypothetical protein
MFWSDGKGAGMVERSHCTFFISIEHEKEKQMGLKDDLEHAGEHIKDAVKDAAHAGERAVKKIQHGADEAMHRGAADIERDRQEDDRLTERERAEAAVEAAKQDIQANVAGVKKKLDDL